MHIESGKYLQRPYVDAPNGEGPGAEYNQKPLYRTDAFDCVTYVNTVLAECYAESSASVLSWIKRFNYYDAQPDYLRRFHFISADWLPELLRQGWIQDITASLIDVSGSVIAQTAQACIDRPAFIRHRGINDLFFDPAISASAMEQKLLSLHQQAVQLDAECVTIPYIPLACLLDGVDLKASIADQIPDHAIMSIVRPNWDLVATIGTHLHVSHIGFIVRQQGQLFYRQASSRLGYVADVLLSDYLVQAKQSPSIAGIHLAVAKA